MKILMKTITAVSLLGIAVGGSMLDSTSLMLPVAMIVPSLAWIGLIGWVNKRNTQ